MFKNPRYVTRRIMADIPLHLQIVLWNMVDKLLYLWRLFTTKRKNVTRLNCMLYNVCYITSAGLWE